MTHRKKVPANSMSIMIEDRYKNLFGFTYPVLKKHRFYAIHLKDFF